MPEKDDPKVKPPLPLDPRPRTGSAAPEVSQGQFRERAFVARMTMPKEEILTGFRQALALLNSWNEPVQRMAAALKTEWLPFFRQVVEQVAGDGLDVRLSQVIGKPISGADLSFADFLGAYATMLKATSKQELIAAGATLVARIEAALEDGKGQPISFKLMEKQFEGRLDLDEVLVLLTCSDDELTDRLRRVIESLEVLRSGMRAGSGGPTGMLWNFSRLKAEKQVIEGEQKVRAAVAK